MCQFITRLKSVCFLDTIVVNYYIERDENFNPKGRVQNLEQSIDKDNEIKILLDINHVPYDIVNKINAVDKITEDILKRLNKNEDN